MNRVFSIVGFALATLALVVALVPRDAPVVVPPPVVDAPRGESPAVEALQRQVEVLQREHRALAERLAVLERAGGAASASAPPAGSGAPSSELQAEAARAAVKDVVREVEAERLDAAQKARAAEWERRLVELGKGSEGRWRQFVSNARLTWAQEQQLQARLAVEEKLRRAMVESLQAGQPMSDEGWRELRRVQRETDQVMAPVLDEPQRGLYQATRRDDRAALGGPNERRRTFLSEPGR